jgi:hypothetical protein
LAVFTYAREWQQANGGSLWEDDDQQAAFLHSIETALRKFTTAA